MNSSAGEQDASLRLDVLGAIRLVIDGQEVDVKRPQVRQLLGLLAARSGQSTSTDLLIEYLWSAKPPADPRAALRVVLSRTRADLGAQADRLETTSVGQRLQASTDAQDFEDLRTKVADAKAVSDPQVAISLAESALGLWRGDPFGGSDAEDLEPIVRRLVDAKWQLSIGLAHSYQEVDDNEAIIALVQPMYEEHPHREEVAMLVALALARIGQAAEGLAVLQNCRDSLRNEYGLGVSDQLAGIENQLLQGGIDLPQVFTSSTEAPKDEVLVDRDEELCQVLEATDRSVIIRAEAGGGKSALLRLVAGSLRASKTPVLFTAAKANPSRPLEAVAGLIESVLAARVEPLSVEMQDAMSRLLPDAFDAPDTATPLTRSAMVDSVVAMLGEHDGGAPVVIIDDAQWLDRLSAEVISRLAETGARLIIGTRPGAASFLGFLEEAGDDGPFAEAERLELSPISHAGAVKLSLALTGSEPADGVVEDLLRRSGGNPLFLELLIGLWNEGEMTNDDLPVSILVTVQQRLGTLSDRARDTVQVASVFGEEFPVGLLRQLAPSADADLAEAKRAGLVITGQSDCYRFRHALLAMGAYQLLSSGQQVVLHDEIGRLLEDAGAAAAEFSVHCEKARSIDPERSVLAATHAAVEYAAVFDWHRVLEKVDVAMQSTSARHRSRSTVLLNLAHGRALRALATDGSVDALLAAARTAKSLDEKELFVEAVTELCTFGQTLDFGGLNDDLLSMLDEAVSLDVPPGSQALLFASGSMFLSSSEQHERSRRLFHQALSLAETAKDLEVEGIVLLHAHVGLGHPEDRELLKTAASRLREIAGGDADLAWEAAFLEFGLASAAADTIKLEELLAELQALTPLVQRRNRDFGMAFTESAHALSLRDFEEAERCLAKAGEAGRRRYGEVWASDLELVILVAIRHAQGRMAELFGAAQAVLDNRPDHPTFQGVVAAAAAAADDREVTERNFRQLSANDFSAIIPDFGWMGVMVLLVDVAQYLDDNEAAKVLYAQLLPYSGSIAWAGVVTFGAVDSALATLAHVMGDTALDYQHQQAADSLLPSAATPATATPAA